MFKLRHRWFFHLALIALATCLVTITVPRSVHADENVFPLPRTLKPAVTFWTRVYTEVSTRGGFVHDARHLDVVYETLDFGSVSAQTRSRNAKRTKRKYKNILLSLAKGKRQGLSSDERAVLALWPADVSNDTLKNAAHSVRFQLGQSDKFRAGLVRSGAWEKYILDTLDEMGLPRGLAALPHVESSFNPNAYSHVGAAGMWQFTRATGRRYMRVDTVVDERLDPFFSTVAAAKLLKQNFALTRTWPLAITAYNHGASGMRRAVKKLGTRNIGTVVRKYKSRTFGFASRNFYASFLAALHVQRNAEKYFGVLDRHEPSQLRTMKLPAYLGAKTTARSLDVNVATLKQYNPSLRKSVWNGSKLIPKGFTLRIPLGVSSNDARAALNTAALANGKNDQHRDRRYKVKRGNTLAGIAARFGVSIGEIAKLNGLRSRHRIRVGQTLKLPTPADRVQPVSVATTPTPADGRYKVRRGDTLSGIARRFGMREGELLAQNNIRNKHRIRIGQTLTVALQTSATTAAVEQPTPEAATEKVQAVEATAPAVESTVVAANTVTAEPSITDQNTIDQNMADQEEMVEANTNTMALDMMLSTGFERPQENSAVESNVVEPSTNEGELAGLVDTTTNMILDEEAQIVSAESDEPVANETAQAAGPTVSTGGVLAADPSDYEVGDNNTIEVQAMETLGHYAEWLGGIRTNNLRKLNRLRRGKPVVIGQRIKLDFSKVSTDTFQANRRAHHQAIQNRYFAENQIERTYTHEMKRNETVWVLANRTYDVPIWLLRQFNPDLDFESIRPGTAVNIPLVKAKAKRHGAQDDPPSAALTPKPTA